MLIIDDLKEKKITRITGDMWRILKWNKINDGLQKLFDLYYGFFYIKDFVLFIYIKHYNYIYKLYLIVLKLLYREVLVFMLLLLLNY